MAPQKGKQGTKGQKQILEENKSTLKFYTIMAVCTTIFYYALTLIFFIESFTTLYLVLSLATAVLYFCALQFMMFMSKAKYSNTGALLDAGSDLNMESGVAEHIKDLIILTCGTQLLTLISNFFWLIWLLAPARAFYMLWVNILAPWIFQPAPPEVDEKKAKKMERKAKRH